MTRKTTKTSVSLLVCLLAFMPLTKGTFTWDKDTLSREECIGRQEAARCTKDATTFYQCPLTCSEDIQFCGAVTQGEADEPDDFFELETPLANSKMLSFDRFEGYVTMVFVIPLMPGMAQYYYDMLEHLHSVYPFTLEIVVFPVRREEYPDVQLTVPAKSKIVVLPELTKEGDKIEANPVLEYMENVISTKHNFVFTDRVTAYIVAFNAKFIEKQGSPTLDFLEKLVGHYLTEMEWKNDL